MTPVARLAPLALIAALFVGGCAPAEEIETPPYEVAERLAEDIEIRRYPGRLAAETRAEGENAAFRRLFDYISGDNEGGAEIAMTAPVETSGGVEIDMTAPVETQAAGDGVRMRFFLPADYERQSAPEPTHPEVRLVEAPARAEAVLRYSGLPLDYRAEGRIARLREALEGSGWRPAGAFATYYYDPPWRMPWNRRNEVMVPVVRAD
jgi:hypothetical protein